MITNEKRPAGALPGVFDGQAYPIKDYCARSFLSRRWLTRALITSNGQNAKHHAQRNRYRNMVEVDDQRPNADKDQNDRQTIFQHQKRSATPDSRAYIARSPKRWHKQVRGQYDERVGGDRKIAGILSTAKITSLNPQP